MRTEAARLVKEDAGKSGPSTANYFTNSTGAGNATDTFRHVSPAKSSPAGN